MVPSPALASKSDHEDTATNSNKSQSPILYLIRHGEKPSKNPDGSDQNGLSEQGLKRAQGLRKVFGADSSYNIQYILAEHPKSDGSRDRPRDTVAPLAADLGVPFNTDVNRDDADKAAKEAKKFNGPGNVLICWEHGQLTDIAKAIGVADAPEYPDDRFDLIWTIEDPYTSINDPVTSEHVPGLDDAH